LKTITLPYNWRPRDYQKNLWRYLANGGKRAVLRGHRRSGKDEVFNHFTCVAAHERAGNYWYMLPEYSQARKSMWDAVNGNTGKRRIDEAFPPEIRKYTREQEMMIGFTNGSTFQLVGSDNFNSLVGSPPVGLVFSEYALSNPSAWGYLRPILLENGGWAGFNSTPRGNNHFKNICDHAERTKDWFYEKWTVDDTHVFTPEQLQEELAELQALHGEAYGKSLWLQEYYVSFDAAIPGSIFGEWIDKAQIQGRMGVVNFEKAPVHTAWDLGHTDATAIWFFQIIGGKILVLDYYENNQKDIPFYCDEVLRKKAKDFGFEYGTHWLPHDARARTLAAGGKSIQQQMLDQRIGKVVIAKRLDHVDGIQAARATIPFCWFDQERCKNGLEVLKNYHYEWDEENRIFSSMPKHDWASHGSSAFRTLSLSWKHPKVAPGQEKTLIERLETNSINKMNFGYLKKQHMDRKRNEREYGGMNLG